VPLLTVPDETPFIAITKWVFDVIARQEHHELQAAMEINKKLTAVATRSAHRKPDDPRTWAADRGGRVRRIRWFRAFGHAGTVIAAGQRTAGPHRHGE
jgi:hypothetical protein